MIVVAVSDEARMVATQATDVDDERKVKPNLLAALDPIDLTAPFEDPEDAPKRLLVHGPLRPFVAVLRFLAPPNSRVVALVAAAPVD